MQVCDCMEFTVEYLVSYRYVFAAIDRNHDGEIDFVEYLMQIYALRHSNLNQRLEVAFDM